MSLKEELGELEREEEIEDEEEARLNAMQEDIYRLHRRIAVIVGYVDKGEEEEPLTEEEMWECGFEAGFEEGGKRAIMDAAKEQTKEESPSSEYAKGYEDGVKALSERMGDGSADPQSDYNMEIIKAIQAALAIKTPGTDWQPLMEILAMRNMGKEEEIDKAATEEQQRSSDYVKGYDCGVKEMIDDNKEKIEAIEKALGINVPSSNLTSLLHAIQQGLATKHLKKEPEKSSGLGKKVGDV